MTSNAEDIIQSGDEFSFFFLDLFIYVCEWKALLFTYLLNCTSLRIRSVFKMKEKKNQKKGPSSFNFYHNKSTAFRFSRATDFLLLHHGQCKHCVGERHESGRKMKKMCLRNYECNIFGMRNCDEPIAKIRLRFEIEHVESFSSFFFDR